MRGYLVTPTAPGRCGAVLVVHENRGLNPYVQDVARRVAVAGFVALAWGRTIALFRRRLA